MQSAFEIARNEIVNLVEHGMVAFMKGRWLCLITDRSPTSIGFVLWQNKCSCQKIHPTCCQGGWDVLMVGSRFCSPAESRYAPIEGELLGITWTLAKTSHYTLGCSKLLVLVDHKLLLGFLKKRGLGEIDNPRLEMLAEKTMRWVFRIEHVAGARNFGPDALSRYPGQSPEYGSLNMLDVEDQAWSDDVEAAVLANVQGRSEVWIVTWDMLQRTGILDSY